jgi:hypothetical protein
MKEASTILASIQRLIDLLRDLIDWIRECFVVWLLASLMLGII